VALNLPQLKASPAMLADWIELRTLADPEGFFRLNNLKRFWDTHRAMEDSDPEGKFSREQETDEFGVSGGDEDVFLDAVIDEIAARAKALGAAYPFAIPSEGLTVRLADTLSVGQHTYLFCLLLTNSRTGELLTGTWLPNIDNRVRDLFQACSTVAAAGEVHGCAVSFGWPRPDSNPPFLEALRRAYTLMGEGVPVNEARAGASLWAKDEEIDIIAWKPRLDGAAGTQYLLGQVASGDNWEAKSIKGGPIDYFHRTWFNPPPPSPVTPSIFIPHAVPPFAEGSRRDRMDLLTEKYGIIFDRLRVPLLVVKGLELLAANPHLTVERVLHLDDIPVWVTSEIQRLRNANEIPL